MLDGVVVLDTGTKVLEYGWGWTWLGFVLCLLGLFALICGVLFLSDGDDVGTGFACLVSACIMFGLSWALFSHAKITKEVPTYKVIIEDSVSMVEFYDKYEILDVQGKIYTIMERED